MADNGNWVSVNRKILDWVWYSDVNTCRLFLHLLLTANWKPTTEGFPPIQLQRGQRIISLRKLSHESSLTIQQVRTALSHLETTQTVTRSQEGKYTVITLNKYNVYQSGNTGSNTELTQSPTANQHTEQQQTNTPYNINNNYNNSIKEENIGAPAELSSSPPDEPKKKSTRFVKPTLEEVQQFCIENGYDIDVEYFYDYYEGNGWKVGKNAMKDWRATVRNWVRREHQNSKSAKGKPNDKNIDPELLKIFGGE